MLLLFPIDEERATVGLHHRLMIIQTDRLTVGAAGGLLPCYGRLLGL